MKDKPPFSFPPISMSKTRLNFKDTPTAMLVSQALNVEPPGRYILVPTARLPHALQQIFEQIINNITFEIDE